MRRAPRFPHSAVALSAGFAIAAASFAGPVWAKKKAPSTLGDLPLAEAAVEILDGRLRLRLPERAAIDPKDPRSTLAKPRTDETRILVDVAQERLEIRAHERFALAGTNFAAAVTAAVGEWSADAAKEYSITEFPPADPGTKMRAVAVRPNAPATSPTGTFVRGLFVASPDGTVQYLEATADAAAARKLDAVGALVEAIFATVVPGGKGLDRRAGTRRFEGPAGEALELAVPAGTAFVVEHGTDYVIARVHLLPPLGITAPSMSVQVGGQPTYVHQKLAAEPAMVDGTLLGRPIQWHRWTSGRSAPKTTFEAIVPLVEGGKTQVHAIVLGRDAKRIDLLRGVAQTLRPATGDAPPAPPPAPAAAAEPAAPAPAPAPAAVAAPAPSPAPATATVSAPAAPPASKPAIAATGRVSDGARAPRRSTGCRMQ